MPQAVAFIGTAFTATAAGTATFLQVATVFAVRTVATLAINSAITKLQGRKKGAAASLSGRTQNYRASLRPRQTIYGQARVGGQIAFFGTSGTDNEYFHIAIIHAEHYCEELGDIYIDGELVPMTGNNAAVGSDYEGFFSAWGHNGSDTQTADSTLVSAFTQWTSNHRLQGLAYTHFRIKFDSEGKVFPNGIPSFSREVKGKRVFDFRDDTYKWTDNAALCTADYVMTTTGVTTSSFDDAAIVAAANLCDETVGLNPSGTEKRYTINGTVDADEDPEDTRARMREAMAGFVEEIGGVWTIHAGGYRAPSLDLSETNFIGPITVSAKQSIYESGNGVRGVFASKQDNYVPIEYPAITNATYLAEDNGIRRWIDQDFDFTVTNSMCQRLAKIKLEKARQSLIVSGLTNIGSLRIRVGDTIRLSNDKLGFVNKEFTVNVLDFQKKLIDGNPFLAVELTLQETAAAIYDWNDGEETLVDIAPNTTLPDWKTVGSATIGTLASGTSHLIKKADGTIISRLYVPWTSAGDAFITSWELEYKKTADSDWTRLPYYPSGTNYAYIAEVEDGVSYDVRIRGINALGVKGDWTPASSHTIVGKSALPVTPTGLSVVSLVEGVKVSWDASTETDHKDYLIFLSTSTTQPSIPYAEVSGTEFIISDLTADVPVYVGIQARDTSLNVSVSNWYQSATPQSRTIAQGTGALGVLAEDHVFPANYEGDLLESINNGDTTIQVFVGSSPKIYNATPTNDTWRVGTVTAVGVTQDTGLIYPAVGISAMAGDGGYLSLEIIYRDPDGNDRTIALRIDFTKVRQGGPTVYATNYTVSLPSDENGNAVDYTRAKWTPRVYYAESERTYAASPTNDRWRYGTITTVDATEDTGLTKPEIGISALSAETGTLSAGIIYRDSEGVDHPILVLGTFTKVRKGLTGDQGDLGKSRVWVYKADNTGVPATPSGNGTPSGWSTERGASGQIWWQSYSIQFADGTLDTGWSTPVRVSGNVTFSSIDKSTIPASILLIGDVAYDSTDLNNPYVWDGAAWDNNGLVSLTVSKLTSGTLTSVGINMVGTSVIRSGQTAFDTGVGYWLGIDGGVPKFSIGNGNDKGVAWDGTTLELRGDLINVGDFTLDTNGFLWGSLAGNYGRLNNFGAYPAYTIGESGNEIARMGHGGGGAGFLQVTDGIFGGAFAATWGFGATWIKNTGLGTPFILEKENVWGIRVDQDGKIGFAGSTTTSVDTTIYRSSANLLRTDDSFRVDGILYIGSSDCQFNRSSANVINTPDSLMVGGVITSPADGSRLADTGFYDRHIEVSEFGSGDRNAYIDLHAGGSSDYDGRWLRGAGANGVMLFTQRGTGGMYWQQFVSGVNTNQLHLANNGNFDVIEGDLLVNGSVRLPSVKPTISDLSTEVDSDYFISGYGVNGDSAGGQSTVDALNDTNAKVNAILSYLNL